MASDPTRRRCLQLAGAAGAGALAGCAGLFPGGPPETEPEEIDDWQYDPDDGGIIGVILGGSSRGGSGSVQYQASGSADGESIGLAAGGAKDVATFRRNVREDYLPIPESLPYEGLFYDYAFDVGGDGTCSRLFCPTYSPAVSPDPLSGETERYLTVGLDSGLAQREFERKRLNLVVVLDVSGSMSAEFDEYYYDRFGNRQTPDGETARPKIDVAKDALVALTEQLRPGDRLGIVLFNDRSAVAKPLRDVERTDMDAIRDHIREDIRAGGGTNIEAGLDDATALLSEYADADPTIYENRTILLTDAQPNLGDTSAGGLRGTLEDNADEGLYTSFVGIGLDFNADLVDRITAIEGSNYYSVHSADAFERRLGEEFEYMVTPLVFDLDLELDAEGYRIEKVYGSTAAEEATGRLMHVNTLFPSPREGDQARGGVVLVKVVRTARDGAMELSASWETRDGRSQSATASIRFPGGDGERYANAGVRKAIVLSRYADLLKNWMAHERDGDVETVARTPADPIEVPPEGELGKWEQQSEPLTVTPPYVERLRAFREHLESEVAAIGDEDLTQEVETLDRILAAT